MVGTWNFWKNFITNHVLLIITNTHTYTLYLSTKRRKNHLPEHVVQCTSPIQSAHVYSCNFHTSLQHEWWESVIYFKGRNKFSYLPVWVISMWVLFLKLSASLFKMIEVWTNHFMFYVNYPGAILFIMLSNINIKNSWASCCSPDTINGWTSRVDNYTWQFKAIAWFCLYTHWWGLEWDNWGQSHWKFHNKYIACKDYSVQKQYIEDLVCLYNWTFYLNILMLLIMYFMISNLVYSHNCGGS